MNDFTIVHPHWFLLCIALSFFPRLSLLGLLIAGSLAAPDGGWLVLFWLGFLVCPRLVIAVLSMAYWPTNYVLIVLAWMSALSGESAEKKAITSKRS